MALLIHDDSKFFSALAQWSWVRMGTTTRSVLIFYRLTHGDKLLGAGGVNANGSVEIIFRHF